VDTQFKSLQFANLKAEASGRSRAGIASVFGNVDAAGDRVMPGAFSKTISEGAKRAKHLWMHSWEYPPIATIEELKEVGPESLPPEVLEKAPQATGGLYVKRTYYNNDLADWVLEAIDAGDINEMSFAYEVIGQEFIDEPIPGGPDGATYKINNLTELRLLDTSDVLYGCNAATVAAGAKGVLRTPPLGVTVQNFLAYAEDVKAGRRNNASDQALIDMMHDAAVGLGASNCLPEPPKSDEAGAAVISTSLDLLKLQTDALRFRAAVINTLGAKA
jgi:phage head maturation protease